MGSTSYYLVFTAKFSHQQYCRHHWTRRLDIPLQRSVTRNCHRQRAAPPQNQRQVQRVQQAQRPQQPQRPKAGLRILGSAAPTKFFLFSNTLWEACLIKITYHLSIIIHHYSIITLASPISYQVITIHCPPYHFFLPFLSIAPGRGVTNDRYTVSADSFCSNAVDSSAPSTLGADAGWMDQSTVIRWRCLKNWHDPKNKNSDLVIRILSLRHSWRQSETDKSSKL